ncbi:MAG: hypothetical protein LQ352_006200 [Teloschistes flavicans]|nr:MAG: hypothetical protein LQ352_006200 [Teloschistes flavicans]
MDGNSSREECINYSVQVEWNASDKYDIPQWMVEMLCGEEDEAEAPRSVIAAAPSADSGNDQNDSENAPSMVELVRGESEGVEESDVTTNPAAPVNEQPDWNTDVPQHGQNMLHASASDAMSDSNTETSSAITPSLEKEKALNSSTKGKAAFGSSVMHNEVSSVIPGSASAVHGSPIPEEAIPRWIVEMLCGSDEDEDEGPDSSTGRAGRERDEASDDQTSPKIAMEPSMVGNGTVVTLSEEASSKSLSPPSQSDRSPPHPKSSPQTNRVRKPSKFSTWTKSSTHNFVQQWMTTDMPAEWSAEKREEEFLIQARRTGMSYQQLLNSQYLKSYKYCSIGRISYQLRKLAGNGVDVVPRTEEYRRRSTAAARSGKHREESERIAEMCREGESVAAIVAAGFIRLGKNSKGAVSQRIKGMREQGVDVAPRYKDVL